MTDDLDRLAGTARWTAAERERETERPDRLFADPLAGALAGDIGRALAERMRGGAEFPGFAIRPRCYDDALRPGQDRPGRRLVRAADRGRVSIRRHPPSGWSRA